MGKNILLKVLYAFFALCIISCSKDDDKKDDSINGGTDGTEAAYFIGKWKQSDIDQTWTFNANGTCVQDYNGHSSYHYEGTWRYVSESKTLITDVNGWIWNVISTSDKQWTGLNVSGKKAYTYNRIVK